MKPNHRNKLERIADHLRIDFYYCAFLCVFKVIHRDTSACLVKNVDKM